MHGNVGSYPWVSVIFSVTASLFLAGMLLQGFYLANKITDRMKDDIRMKVFLNRTFEKQEFAQLRISMSQLTFVQVDDKGPAIEWISREQAAQEMIEQTGEDFLNILEENPLRDSFVIRLKPEWQNADSVALAARILEQLPGVFEVYYAEDLAEEIYRNLRNAGAVLLPLIGALLLTVVVLINSAVRLSLFSQRFLIRNMQLVGATPSFIQAPFIKSAGMYGFISGLFSSLLLSLTFIFLLSQVQELEAVFSWVFTGLMMTSLSILGLLICSLSALFATGRLLKLPLDELY